MITSLYYSCGYINASPVNQIFPTDPDTTSILELAIFLEPDQLNVIIDEETTLLNG